MDGKFRGRLVRITELIRRNVRGAHILALISLIFLLVLLWTGDYAFGNSNDSWGHINKAQYLADLIQERGIEAYFNSAWKPQWYMGDPYRTYYPPLTLLVLAPIALVVSDPGLIHQIFATMTILLFGGLTFIFIKQLWGPTPASLGFALAIWAPYQLRTLFFEGNYPRALALVALPIIALYTEKLLDTTGRRMPTLAALSMAWCWAILAHPQQALIFAIGFGFYILSRLFIDPDTPLQWAALWIGALAIGAVLSAPWALPAYSRGELSNVPYLPAEKVALFVSSVRSFMPAFDVSNGQIIFGFGVLVLALLATTARPDPKRTAFTLSGLLAIWLSIGTPGVLFGLLPLSDLLLPERFLNYAVFALAVAAAGLVPIGRMARAGRVFILMGLFVVDVFPSVKLIQGSPYPDDPAVLEQVTCQEEHAGCRSALMVYPEPTSQEVYFSTQAGPIINGWALENTPHNETLRRYLGAATWSPEYLRHLLGIWNVSTAVLRGEEATMESVGTTLSEIGFKPRQDLGEYQIWDLQSSSSPLQVIPEDRALVVGAGLPPLLLTYPFAQQAEKPYLSSLDDAIFADHPMLILSQFEDSTSRLDEAEGRLSEYLQSGGTVVLDLSGMETTLGRSTDVFDVDVLRLNVVGEIPIRWQEGLSENLPSVLSLSSIAADGWSGAVYDNLDEVLAEIQYLGEWYPVFGYRDLDQGRAWFVGMNLLYYAQLSGETIIVDEIRKLSLEGVEVSQEIVFPGVEVDNWMVNDRGLEFDFTLGENAPEALISYTYSPRWNITIDGQPVAFQSYENLIQLGLPAGEHHIEISYQPYGTAWPIAGLMVGLVGAIGLAGLVFLERTRELETGEEEAKEPETVAEAEFSVCGNCGFRLVETKPPTAITYPFQVVDCPICGDSMTDEGYQPGRELSLEQRNLALAAWLEQQEQLPVLDEAPLVTIPDDFFEINGHQTRVVEEDEEIHKVGSQGLV